MLEQTREREANCVRLVFFDSSAAGSVYRLLLMGRGESKLMCTRPNSVTHEVYSDFVQTKELKVPLYRNHCTFPVIHRGQTYLKPTYLSEYQSPGELRR